MNNEIPVNENNIDIYFSQSFKEENFPISNTNNLDDNFFLKEKKTEYFYDLSPYQNSFSSNKSYNINNIINKINQKGLENYIIEKQKIIKEFYDNLKFEMIINYFTENYGNEFFEYNQIFLYICRKLLFFRILLNRNESKTLAYYNESLLPIMKIVKPNKWKTKNIFFEKLIRKPCSLNKNFVSKYYEQFQFELDKSLRNFYYINQNPTFSNYNNNNNNHNNLNQKADLNEEEINTNKKNINNNNNNNNNNNYDIAISNASTKEEFSDFEDEYEMKMCNNNVNNNNENINNNNNLKIDATNCFDNYNNNKDNNNNYRYNNEIEDDLKDINNINNFYNDYLDFKENTLNLPEYGSHNSDEYLKFFNKESNELNELNFFIENNNNNLYHNNNEFENNNFNNDYFNDLIHDNNNNSFEFQINTNSHSRKNSKEFNNINNIINSDNDNYDNYNNNIINNNNNNNSNNIHDLFTSNSSNANNYNNNTNYTNENYNYNNNYNNTNNNYSNNDNNNQQYQLKEDIKIIENKKTIKINKEEETLYKKLPILSSFKPDYAKRETIDKKTIRAFRHFIISENKCKRFQISKLNKDYSFYILFINGNILPPVNILNENTGEYINFKSFNSNFLLWFFSREGMKDLYNQWINMQGNILIESISKNYKLDENRKKLLKNYIYNLPNIFDVSLVNDITNGQKFNHIYRKKKFNTTKIRKERSRDKEENNINNETDSSFNNENE